MQRKIMLLMATLTALGLVAGVAWAAIPPAELTVSSEKAIEVGDAGEVVLALGTSELSVIDVLTNPGWTSETEVAAGPEVEAHQYKVPPALGEAP